MRFLKTLILLATFTSPFATMSQTDGPLIGMALLSAPHAMNSEGILETLRKTWHLEVDAKEPGDTVSVLSIDGYTVALALMPFPIPGDEVKETAAYNYLWPEAGTEAVAHTGHIIISLMNGGKDPVKDNLLFTKVVASVLQNSSAFGVYMGDRTLLIKKDFYLSNLDGMSEQELPLINWIYFGLRVNGKKCSVYTYGLAAFGKSEMEVVDSKHSMEEVTDMMYATTHYVLASDVTLKPGETLGFTADQKLKISRSPGKYLPGETLKISY
jgi:hypothetical protein